MHGEAGVAVEQARDRAAGQLVDARHGGGAKAGVGARARRAPLCERGAAARVSHGARRHGDGSARARRHWAMGALRAHRTVGSHRGRFKLAAHSDVQIWNWIILVIPRGPCSACPSRSSLWAPPAASRRRPRTARAASRARPTRAGGGRGPGRRRRGRGAPRRRARRRDALRSALLRLAASTNRGEAASRPSAGRPRRCARASRRSTRCRGPPPRSQSSRARGSCCTRARSSSAARPSSWRGAPCAPRARRPSGTTGSARCTARRSPSRRLARCARSSRPTGSSPSSRRPRALPGAAGAIALANTLRRCRSSPAPSSRRPR